MKKIIGAIAVISVVFFSVAPVFAATNGMTLIASGSLGSAATTLTVSSIPASEDLEIRGFVTGLSGADLLGLQFNSDTGANYATQYCINGCAGAGSNSVTAQTYIRLQPSASQDLEFVVRIKNLTSFVKRGDFYTVRNATSGAITRYDGGIAWDNTSAQISSITLLTVGASVTMATGTSLNVYGYDSGSVASLPANASGLLKNDGSGNLSWDSASTVKTFLSLGNVENTGFSTWNGSTALTTLGTMGTGVWNGTVLTVPYGGTSLSTITSGAFMRGNGTSAPSLLSPSASATDYLDGTAAWSVPAGGGGVSLPADANGYLLNDGAGALSWDAGTGTVVTNYDTMFDAVALMLFAGGFVIFFGLMFYKN